MAAIALMVAAPYLAPMIAGVAIGTMTATVMAIEIGLMLAAAALSFVATMLLKPKAPKMNQSMQDRLNARIEPTAPRKIVFGLTAAGADVRFEEQVPLNSTNTSTPPTLYQVIALASHKLTSVQSVTFENELSYSSGAVTGKYAAGLTIAPTLEGTATNGAAFGSGSWWTSASTFTGCAYLKITYKLDSKIFPDSVPTRITTIVQGCPCFDPRLSTSVGGSGSQSPTDQTTWTYSRNPACQLLTYLLGYRVNGKLAWGMGIPTSRIDFSNFIVFANVCDESVTTLGGGTTNRYFSDVILDTAMTHEACITAITAAMGTATLVDTGGLYSLVGGHDDTTGPIAAFSQDDLVGGYTWSPALASRDRFNIATGQFADPTNLYVLGTWGTISVDPLNDGIPRTQQMDFAAVTRSEQCQRIAKQRIVRNQFSGTFTCNFGPRAFNVAVGSLLYLSLPAESWNNKLFRVIDQQESAELIFQMTLQEESSTIYAWDYNETQVLPPNVNIAAYDATQTTTPQSLTASARQTTSSTGATESYIDLHWSLPSTAVRSIQIQAKPSSESIWQNITSNADPFTGGYTFRAPLAGVSTDVQARYEMTSDMLGAWVAASVTAASGSANGLNNATVELFQRAATQPAVPSVTTTYTFATSTLTGQNNGWLTSAPTSNGNPLWLTAATASSAGTTDTIATTEWATPVVLAMDGTSGSAGATSASLSIYKRSASTPALPSAATTYTFSTGVLSGLTNGWTQAVPTANGQPLYTSTATALSTGTTDTIAASEWATPSVMAQDGAAGPTVTLNASAGAFYYVDGIPTSTAQTVTFTAASTNGSDTFTFGTSPTVTLTGTGATRTMSLSAFGTNQQCTVTVTGSASGVSASYTVFANNETSNSDSIIPDPNYDGSATPTYSTGKPWTQSAGVHTQLP